MTGLACVYAVIAPGPGVSQGRLRLPVDDLGEILIT